MQISTATLIAFAAGAIGAPSSLIKELPRQAAGCDAAVTLDASTNPFTGRTLHPNVYYRTLVEAAAAEMEGDLKESALKVADIGTFVWLDTIEHIERLEPNIADVPCDNILGVVVYDLPGRDCAAKASNGELDIGEIERYKTEYIDVIAATLEKHSNTAFALVIEPDSLPNLITNIDQAKCQQAADGYREGVAYAFEKLNLPNVVMYVDAGHGGWLGWPDNQQPAADELAKVWKAAGSPKQVRGFATNVSGWNQWDMLPGEFKNTTDGQWNPAENESKYVEIFGAALEKAGMPNHAITDVGRSGQSGGRLEWGDWCNVVDAGFGRRPGTETDNPLADAFVWVKPGGESDGTSDSSADRYDSFCGLEDAFKPSPEAGTWNQAYFEMLVKNANPPL